MSRAFVDSHIVVYALGRPDARRSEPALELLADLAARRELVLSTQVLVESFHVLTRKQQLAPGPARAALERLADHATEAPDAACALAAMALGAAHGLSAWDALIVQSAVDAGCRRLYTEDLQHGRRFGPLLVIDPFSGAGVQEPAAAWPPAEVAPTVRPSRSGAARRPHRAG